ESNFQARRSGFDPVAYLLCSFSLPPGHSAYGFTECLPKINCRSLPTLTTEQNHWVVFPLLIGSTPHATQSVGSLVRGAERLLLPVQGRPPPARTGPRRPEAGRAQLQGRVQTLLRDHHQRRRQPRRPG